MTNRQKILIATTNKGKLEEIESFMKNQPCEWLSLSDLEKNIQEPEENSQSIEENSFMKAKYYAEASGCMTIADDTGLFIDALDGWPGVHVGRIRRQDDENFSLILQKMEGKSNRKASFRCAVALYDPKNQVGFLSLGSIEGEISESPSRGSENHWGYNKIFYIKELGKTFGEMSLQEKLTISHRSKSLIKIKYFIDNQYGPKHIPVPLAFVIKNGKILMILRNDPHNPEIHKKWEFPGGGINLGEIPEKTVVRETSEEVGYTVEVVQRLSHIDTEEVKKQSENIHYQLLLIPYVCRIIGGDGKCEDTEVLEARWFALDEVLDYDLGGCNPRVYQTCLPELKEIIKIYNL